MINSANTLDIIKPKLLNMDKFNATSATRLHHHNHAASMQHTSPTRAYLTFVTKASPATIEAASKSQVGLQHPQRQEQRVKVQHLENHTKLQNNNCWNNFRTLYNLSASSAIPVDSSKFTEDQNVKANDDDIKQQQQQQQRKNDIQNKSAFNTIESNKRNNIYSNNTKDINISNNNTYSETDRNNRNKNNSNNTLYAKLQEKVIIEGKEHEPSHKAIAMSLGPTSHRRTEDQEHAYRRIESVHNYAKLKAYDDEEGEQSLNGSRQSSYIYEEDDYDEEDDEDDDEEQENDNDGGDYDPEEDEMIDLDEDYEDILNRRRFSKILPSPNGIKRPSMVKELIKSQNCTIRSHRAVHTNQQEDEIDVETVEHPVSNVIGNEMNNIIDGGHGESPLVKPDHHARRPMNAFLIFCKRHRAIVKERYKTLENRAITKILGDWWASLDANDKQCFTNLAQQNKDAFFSANPNFKWYKLPAPPLRTLSTRPTNVSGVGECDDCTNTNGGDGETISNNTRSGSNNYFKLADEAQMGDLSHLMQDKIKNKDCALQQALGETSQFMSTHLMGTTDAVKDPKTTKMKRQLYNENSFSSNSSEEDGSVPKKKSARSCKGKIYQELINSGQIAAPAVKKSKSSQRLLAEGGNLETSMDLDIRQKFEHNGGFMNLINSSTTCDAKRQRHFTSESDNVYSCDFATFDLEEKIKELPALCLDDYLQRKRNTKKKKKFSSGGKRKGGNRNTNSINSASQIKSAPSTDKLQMLALSMQQQIKQQQQAAVGSQKRKARKESITRRDVSAIEQEVASLLPLTINGCCYFQETTMSLSPKLYNNNNITGIGISYNNDIVQKDPKAVQTFRQTSPIIPMITTTTSISSTMSLSSVSVSTSSPTPPSSSASTSPTSPHQQSTATAMVNMLNETLNDNISSSTSDLLILAEVAANRTEIKH